MKIGRPKHLILDAVGRFQYLSTVQLARLHFSPSSLTYVQKHDGELVKEDYLRKLYLPTLTGLGRRTFYTISAKGYAYLGDKSLPPPVRFKDVDEPYRNALFLKHTEAAADLMILALLLPRADPRVTVTRYLTEAQLKRKKAAVKPDGWIEFQAVKRCAIAFELDRGTVARKDWEKKIKDYSIYDKGGYKTDYDSGVLIIATVTTSLRRMSDLMEWTTQTLMDINDPGLAVALYFACFDPVKTSPEQAFLSPIWRTPEQPHLQPLVPEDLFG